jgi:hypothetical protein
LNEDGLGGKKFRSEYSKLHANWIKAAGKLKIMEKK